MGISPFFANFERTTLRDVGSEKKPTFELSNIIPLSSSIVYFIHTCACVLNPL